MISEAVGLAQLLDAMKRNGYVVFEDGKKPFNLNIIGIRAEKQEVDGFDDYLVALWREQTSKGIWRWHHRSWEITTLPGRYYLINRLLNRKGCAILAPGQYRGAYKIGLHKGTTALIQTGAVRVFRDDNKDEVYDYTDLEKGFFGINIHRAGKQGTTEKIGRWSAGCQVFQNADDFQHFMWLCKEARSHWGNSFTYTLLEEKDIREI